MFMYLSMFKLNILLLFYRFFCGWWYKFKKIQKWTKAHQQVLDMVNRRGFERGHDFQRFRGAQIGS